MVAREKHKYVVPTPDWPRIQSRPASSAATTVSGAALAALTCLALTSIVALALSSAPSASRGTLHLWRWGRDAVSAASSMEPALPPVGQGGARGAGANASGTSPGPAKIAFLFLTKGPLPLAPLWDRFLRGHEARSSVYIHASPGHKYRPRDLPPRFRGRQIPSQRVSWGDPSLSSAERRLLGAALADRRNAFFVMLSEACIPVFNFSHAYAYVAGSRDSFLTSVDDRSDIGRPLFYAWTAEGRPRANDLAPAVREDQWRKGDAWFELHRELAVAVTADNKYFPLFAAHHRDHRHNGVMDEHYLPTVLGMTHGRRLANRTLTFTDWFVGKKYPPHPREYNATTATRALVRDIRARKAATYFNYEHMTRNCTYNGRPAEHCYLFARKFGADALRPLLDMAAEVMYF